MAITDHPIDRPQQTDAPRPRRTRREPAEPRRAQRPKADEPTAEPTLEPAEAHAPADGAAADEQERTAATFRELHERRLHAFALLLTLGDRPRAAKLTEGALAAAAERPAELAHPERGAAWLRNHVLRAAGGGLSRLVRRRRAPANAAIPEIGASEALLRGLGALSLRDRAALILSDVERFRELDVADALGAGRSSVEDTVRRSRERYGRAFLAAARASGALESLELPDAIREAAGPPLRRRAERTS